MSIEYKLVEVRELGKLHAGTQIAVQSLFKNLHPWLEIFYPLFSSDKFYYHHGVYLGNCEVVHFSGENENDAKPRRCDIFPFKGGAVDGKLYQVEYDDPNLLLPVEATLKKAKDVLAEPTMWPGYQIKNNNCESFATWLKTGQVISAQAMKAFDRVIKISAGAGVGVVGSLVGSVALR